MKSHDVRIQLVKIPVSDFERATEFYREKLGLEEQFAMPDWGWAQYTVGDLGLCLFVPGKGGGERGPGGDSGVHLAVDGLQGLHAALTERGANPGELHTGDDGSSFFDVTDPDGNVIKVMQG